MIDLEEPYLTEIKNILQKNIPNLEVRIFGSRINGNAKKYSDIDLVIVDNQALNSKNISNLKDQFFSIKYSNIG